MTYLTDDHKMKGFAEAIISDVNRFMRVKSNQRFRLLTKAGVTGKEAYYIQIQ